MPERSMLRTWCRCRRSSAGVPRRPAQSAPRTCTRGNRSRAADCLHRRNYRADRLKTLMNHCLEPGNVESCKVNPHIRGLRRYAFDMEWVWLRREHCCQLEAQLGNKYELCYSAPSSGDAAPASLLRTNPASMTSLARLLSVATVVGYLSTGRRLHGRQCLMWARYWSGA